MGGEGRRRTQDLYSDTMLNQHLSQKLKLIKMDKFNHLINTLTSREYTNNK
jgi:hypothetical protein